MSAKAPHTIQERTRELQVLINKFMDRHPERCLTVHLKQIERQHGIPRAALFVGGVSLVTLTVVWLLGGEFVSNMGGFFYPAYASLKVLEDPTRKSSTMWLEYWITFALVGCVDGLFGFLLHRIPLFSMLKLFFFAWCFNPKTLGAHVVFMKFIRPSMQSIFRALHAKVEGVARPANAQAKGAVEATEMKAADNVIGPSSLRVTVLTASGLPPMEDGQTDSYCLLKMQDSTSGTALSSKCRTSTKPASLDPKWNDKLQLTLKGSLTPTSELDISVWHKTGLGRDLFIGCVAVPLAGLAVGEEQDGVYDLADPKGENPTGVSGDIRLLLLLE